MFPGTHASGNYVLMQRRKRDLHTCRPREGQALVGSTVHRRDADSQYASVHCREKIVLGGMKRSIGTVGVDYDNSLVETTIGFYKTGATRKDPAVSDGPLRSVRDVEWLTRRRTLTCGH